MAQGVESFLDELASDEPVPGGGSVAALSVAMGAALLEMVANLTIGRKRYAEVEDEARTIRAEAASLRARAWHLVTEDVDAYRLVSLALALPRETDDERAARRERVQSALKQAALPPLNTMRAAREAALLADRMVDIGNRSAISDVGTAVVSARAGYLAARLNVEINVAAVRDDRWVSDVRSELASVSPVDELERSVLRRVEAAIQDSGG